MLGRLESESGLESDSRPLFKNSDSCAWDSDSNSYSWNLRGLRLGLVIFVECLIVMSYYRATIYQQNINVTRRVASGGQGEHCPPDFRFCPPPPDLFVAPHGIFLGGKSCCFWPEKPFEFVISARKSLRISAKTFFFWRSPDFHWNFTLIQFRNNESLGQVQRWFSALPPNFNFAPPISRSWWRPWMWQAMHHLWQGEISYLNQNENNWIRFYSLATAFF